MKDPSFYVSGLLELHRLADDAQQRATWRQAMTALAHATAEDGPRPLDGLHPEAVLRGVKTAIQRGLVDDLDWLQQGAAGAALYELASALPPGAEQRELGRRVLSRLLAGNAEAFAALATRMAIGGGKGLASAGARARVALLVELPIGLGVADGALALALASRRDLAREWINVPSTGSLPARRLAARLLERAAREAARRASQGDAYALRAFRVDAVSEAWQRLLADRESLVWRHVAVARGLLAPWMPDFDADIQTGFGASLSPTEWRRAATSVAAEVAVATERALGTAQGALAEGLLDRDPGAAAAFAWGIARAAEAEPDAAAELLESLTGRAPAELAEALLELRAELGPSPLIAEATGRVLASLGKKSGASGRNGTPGAKDDGAEALALEIARDLEQAARDDQPVREQLARALHVFAVGGAREAYAAARDVLDAAKGAMDALDAVAAEEDAQEGRAGSLARRTSLAVLRDLDISLLERSLLVDMLHLGAQADAARAHDDLLDAIRERVADWILTREAAPLVKAPEHPMLSLRRLRALLHLVDSDMGAWDEEGPRVARLRERWLRVARALMDRFEHDPPSVVRRTILASLARAIDALVRVGACDVSDVLLVVARNVVDPQELETLAEASMDPDLIHVLVRFASFSRARKGDGVAALEELARDLAPDPSGRIEALRAVLVRLHAALVAVKEAASLRALAPSGSSEPEVVLALESALGALSQMALGARGRLDPARVPSQPHPFGAIRPLTVAVSRVLAGGERSLREPVIVSCLDQLLVIMPKAIAELVADVVWGLSKLPVDGATKAEESAAKNFKIAEALPTWIPARRTLGGFYVLRPLSAGAVGSVFVVTRVEDKNDPNAERFALKVPEYSATAARSVSEADFMKMFREEASALLTLPHDQHLARFVTFDAGARPKPILVMELVEGLTLERLIESRALDTPRAIVALDHVLAGLEVMHAAGVGHLDLKPSNVVMRKGEQGVLVDFGLAGKHLRLGCATGPYGAPEVWGAGDHQSAATPAAADVYAFGCVAYEVLTGRTLFDAPNEMALIAAHVAHDGFPAPLRALSQRPGMASLAELLFSCLRRDPTNRPRAKAIRADLARLRHELVRLQWPVT